jgi:hypothetical protein
MWRGTGWAGVTSIGERGNELCVDLAGPGDVLLSPSQNPAFGGLRQHCENGNGHFRFHLRSS